MTSIASPASSTTTPASVSTLSPAMARALLVLVTAASVAAGLLATGTEASASAVALAGADLTHLLRAMALLKVAMAAGMAAAVLWRLGLPVTLAWWAAYALACAGMAAGPGLIWQMAYVRTGALLLHAGLFAALILLWRDPAMGVRLGYDGRGAAGRVAGAVRREWWACAQHDDGGMRCRDEEAGRLGRLGRYAVFND